MNEPDLTGLDPQARRLLAMVALGSVKGAYASVEDRRRAFERLMRFAQRPTDDVERSDISIPNPRHAIPARIYAPGGLARPRAGLVYFHGGGLVAGSIATHDALCHALAVGARCCVVSVDYRLAPEHPFPAAIIDALYATRWLFRHAAMLYIDSFAIGGDSGGATLAAIVCQLMQRRVPIKAQVLLCPVLDFAGSHISRTNYGDGFMLDTETMIQDLVHYAPTRSNADPRISPLRHPSLVGMPRTLIHTAGFDPLRDEGAAYAGRLRDAGVVVEHVCHEALIHHFYGLTAAIPAARRALSMITADLVRVLR